MTGDPEVRGVPLPEGVTRETADVSVKATPVKRRVGRAGTRSRNR